MMSYKEVMDYALAYYNEGGDGTYETLSEADYLAEIAEGVVFTEAYLRQQFRIWNDYSNEMFAMASW